MIQANELRIGNWVETYPSSKIEQVYDLMCDCINTKTKEKLPFDCVDPIPLTPEILERCGFEKDESGEYEDGEYVSNTKPVFRWTKGDYNEWYIIFQFDYGCEWTAAYHVRTLHQLQNLYFALTGEELECNPCK